MNTNMSGPQSCHQCGAPLPTGALAGLCPACLLQQGALDSVPESAAVFVPPTVTELGSYFPQLEILKLIGKGGMGAVYQARQKELDRLVAVKILPPGVSGDPSFAERFAREAKALARLNHPHIVTIHDFGQTGGLFYFIMEFVDGVNLRQLLHAGRVTPREALAIVPQICDALQYAHDGGIVHRDIKPENILIDRQGRVKVADFGLAKLMETREAATEAGQVLGTPPYMAPEQRECPAAVDHRADIYSLGVVFYQMLTGELPDKQLEPPSKKVVVDVRLDEVVLRALEKKPELRYQQVSEVKTIVETISANPPSASVAPLPSATTPASAPRFSKTAIVGALWALLFFFLIVSVIFFSVAVQIRYASASGPSGMPGEWLLVILAPFLLMGVTAPFGTTILGWVAVSQIRRSGGRLYGLWLALLDGLFFPALLAIVLLAYFMWTKRPSQAAAANDMGSVIAAPSPGSSLNVLLIVALGVLLVGGLAGLIYRRRRKARLTETAPAAPEPVSPSSTQTVFGWLALGFFAGGLVLVVLLMGLNKENAGALVGMTCLVLALVFGVIGRRHSGGRIALWGSGVCVVGMTISFVVYAFQVRNKMEQREREIENLRPVAIATPSTQGAASDQRVMLFDWQQLAAAGRLRGGQIVTVDGGCALKIENTNSTPLSVPLLQLEQPSITGLRYAITGAVRYENVAGDGYLEMWSDFAPSGGFFSRTRGVPGSGAMAALRGTSGWRKFMVPFDRTGTKAPPSRIELNMVLPGRGVVYLQSVALVEDVMDPADRAVSLVELLAQQEFALAPDLLFDDTLKQALPAEQLSAVWRQLAAVGGAYLGHDAPRPARLPPYDLVYVPCRWERNRLDAKVVFNPAGQISGLWFVPPGEK